jgi:hypothetical protein
MVYEYTSEINRYIPSIVKLDENGYYSSAESWWRRISENKVRIYVCKLEAPTFNITMK